MSARSEEKQIAATLEAIQRQGYSRLGHEPTVFTKENIIKASDAVLFRMKGRHETSWIEAIKADLMIFKKDIYKNTRAAITSIENPTEFQMLNDLIEHIQKALTLVDIQIPHSIRFGTSHSGRLNSAMISLRNNRFRLLVVESGLFTFANLFAKVFVSCLCSTETAEGHTFDLNTKAAGQRIALSSEPFRRFSELMIAYVVFGNPSRAPQYMPSSRIASFAVRIIDGFETFCVAHGYGHCIAGHLDADRGRQQYLLPDIDGQHRPNDTTWAEVFEADRIAATITIQVIIAKGYDVPLALIGVFLFFDAVELIERATDVLNTGARAERPDDPSWGHPPASLRRAKLVASLEERRDDLAEQFTAATFLPGMVAEITGPLWDLLEPTFRDQHDAGYRSSYIWENEGVL